MPKLPKIVYYFDVFSPYSWIGFEALHQIKPQWKNVDVKFIPFSLKDVFIESGNKPPAMLPNRGRMLFQDIRRSANYWGMNLKSPTKFMEWLMKYSTTDACKLLIVLEKQNEDLMLRAAREMSTRLWWRDQKIFEVPDLLETLKSIGVSDVDAVEYLAQIQNPDVAEKLKANTRQVIDSNGYGAPWIVVHTPDGKSHEFFGSDRFHLIAELLELPQPVPTKYLNSKI